MNILKNRNWIEYGIPLLLIILNAVLKFAFVNSNSIANDEPFSIYHAQLDVPSIIQQLTQGNNPPLFEIMLHFWIKLFGIGVFSVRFLPCCFSIVTVVILYKIGSKFFNKNIAIIACLLFTFSNVNLYHAHETRVYSWLVLCTCISFYLFLSLLRKSDSKKYFILLFSINTIIIYSHYIGFAILISQWFCVLLNSQIRKTILKKYFLNSIIVLLLYLPLLSVFFLRFFYSTKDGTWIAPSTFTDVYNMLWSFSNAPVTTVLFISILLLSIVKFYFNEEKISSTTFVIMVWFLLPFIGMFFASLKYFPKNIPVFNERYVFFTSIAYYIITALAINYLLEKIKWNRFLIFIPVLFMLFSFEIKLSNKRNTEQAISRVKALKSANSIVYICADWFDMNFVYYYNETYFSDINNQEIKKNFLRDLSNEGIYPIQNATQIDTLLCNKADKIIYLDAAADFAYPGNNILKMLSNKYKKTDEQFYPAIYKVFVFQK